MGDPLLDRGIADAVASRSLFMLESDSSEANQFGRATQRIAHEIREVGTASRFPLLHTSDGDYLKPEIIASDYRFTGTNDWADQTTCNPGQFHMFKITSLACFLRDLSGVIN